MGSSRPGRPANRQPVVSNLNFFPGQTVPNLVTVKIGPNGRVNLYNSQGYTHLIADVVGYYTASRPPSGGLFTAVTPGRVLDTRDGNGHGGSTAPVGPGQTINVQVTGLAGVPSSGVSGVALNVTVDQPTRVGIPDGVADRRDTAICLESQLRARADGGQPRAGQGRHRWASQHLQLRWQHTRRSRRHRLLLGDRRRLRSSEPATNCR